MFNLFPPKKSVDEILEDNGLSPFPTTDWEPVGYLQEQQEIIDELMKEIKDLRHLKQENVDLMEMLAKYRDGYQGSCYACEPVGELNQKLELQIKALHKIIDGAKETIDKLKKDLQDVKNENNSLKIFPPKDCGDVRLQKHPIYPIHWGGYSVDTTWEQATSDLALRVVKLEKQVEELKLINSQVNINKKS
jgi:prefoldin subunit 5